MYSAVHSSIMPQHSHFASSTSEIGGNNVVILSTSLLSSKEMSDIVRLRLSDESLGGFMKLFDRVWEPTRDSPCGAIVSKERERR